MDGGDQRYGFLQPGGEIDNIKGITVRGFPPSVDGLKTFPLGRKAAHAQKKSDLLFTGPVIAILKILEDTSDALCTKRPKSLENFKSVMVKVASTSLHAPWGASVYDLRKGEIIFRRTVNLPREKASK